MKIFASAIATLSVIVGLIIYVWIWLTAVERRNTFIAKGKLCYAWIAINAGAFVGLAIWAWAFVVSL